MYCNYFQAHVPPADCFLVIGFFKSYDHVCFARTVCQTKSIVEFFVPESTTKEFLLLAHYLEQKLVLFDLQKKENRLQQA